MKSWLRTVVRRSRMEADMDAELRFHIESYQDDLMRRGISREEASRQARIEFGGFELQKEECRAALGMRLLDELAGDIRYAARLLRKNPGFTAVAIVTLALGIGANTAIFTLAQETLLKSMPVPHSEQLRMFSWARTSKMHSGPAWGSFGRGDAGEMTGTPFPYPLLKQMQSHNSVLEELVAFKDIYQLTASADGQSEAVDGMLVSGNFYRSIGARVIAGRAIGPEDDSVTADGAAVISYAYWARRFGRSADVLGRTLNVNRVPVTIVGVNAPEFNGPKAGGTPEIFLPISLQPRIVPNPRGSLLSDHSFWWVMVMGRLKPGVTDRAAALSLGISFRDAFHATIPEKKDTDLPRFFLIRGNRGLDLQRDDLQHPIYLLLSLAGLILLIACANLANLLLARGAARQREMSVRLAIGAGRFRIARQVLTEALVLALMGGLAGLFVGYACRNIIPHLLEEPWSGSPLEIRFNWPVFGFALGLTIATGLLFGFMPAWRASRENINTGLQEGGRMSAGRSKALLSKSLVVCQVAVGLLLLIGAGLFVRTLVNLRNTSTGLSTERILLFALNPPQSHYSPQQRTRLYQRIEEKVAALPAVQSATLSSDALLAEQMDNSCYRPTADPARAPDSLAGAWNGVWTNSVGPRFFETFRIPIVAGRSLAPGDNAQAPLAGVINRRLAQKFFPTTSPIGQTLSACEAGSNGRDIRIVGVSADAKYSGLREDSPPTLYLSYLQDPDPGSMTFELKSAASPASLAAEIRLAVRQVDPDVPVLDVRTQMQQIDATLSQERLFATVTSTFGLLALLLVSAGIYGVTAYTVSRRTNEIGIRMALGADAWKVVIMVLRENSLLGVCGVVLGLVSAFALSRVVAAMLFGLRATDPLTYGAAGVLLIALTIAAGFAPARRAANVSPTESLRHD